MALRTMDWSVLAWGAFMLTFPNAASGCTTLAVGKKVSKDGSTITSHSDDAEYDGDPRLCHIPAANYTPGSMRPVYWDNTNYPRVVTTYRGPCYHPLPGQDTSVPICEVPQVEHTFSYFEGVYQIMNEKGVGMSESTCSGMYAAKPKTMGGEACFGIMALSQIALERASTAAEAVDIMGQFAEEYGFYGGDTFEGGAESLFVNDADEIWIFHVLPDPTATSAIWAAQRVPDDHVSVIANMFIIREIDFEDAANFKFSKSVKSVALQQRWWSPGEPLDFTKLYSHGEYSHKYYTGRRMWGALLKFGVEYNDQYSDLRYSRVYPVTSKPNTSTPIDLSLILEIHRWNYEGTRYDMGAGAAAGPWGITDRWNNEQNVAGTWERSIAVYRTDYLSVVQGKKSKQGGVFWFGPHCAASTVFVPMAATCTEVPPEYSVVNPSNLSRSNAYWAHKYNFNMALMKYREVMTHVIKESQKSLELEGQELVTKLDTCNSVTDLNAAYEAHMKKVWLKSWELPDKIMMMYADGWFKDGPGKAYPNWWLKEVGYTDMDPPGLPAEPYGPCYPNPCPEPLPGAHALYGTANPDRDAPASLQTFSRRKLLLAASQRRGQGSPPSSFLRKRDRKAAVTAPDDVDDGALLQLELPIGNQEM